MPGTTIGTTARCCSNLQHALDELKDNAPNANRNKNGVLEALRSPQNTGGVEVVQSVSQLQGAGVADGVTACKMEILYEKPDCVAAVDSEIDICSTPTSIGDTRGYLAQEVLLYAGRAGTFTLDEFDCICERPDERMAKTILKLARSVNKQMEIQAATSIAGFLSDYANGDDSADTAGGFTRLLNITNTDHVNAAEWAKLRAEYRKQFSMDDPIIVGGDILAQYDDIRLAGLGANAIGANPALLHQTGNKFVSYELDDAAEAVIGAPGRPAGSSFAYSWMPGAIQLLEYYENRDTKEWFWEKSTRTTIVVDGVLFDWYMMFDECAEAAWKFKLEKRYDFFHIPTAAYAPCFPSNGNLLWHLGCGDPTCVSVV